MEDSMYLRLGWKKIIDATYCNSSYLLPSFFLKWAWHSFHFHHSCFWIYGICEFYNNLWRFTSPTWKVIELRSESSCLSVLKIKSNVWRLFSSVLLLVWLCKSPWVDLTLSHYSLKLGTNLGSRYLLWGKKRIRLPIKCFKNCLVGET